jgi:hypothetical protein
MTEADWLSSTDPQAMLTFLWNSGKLSERKARLFAVACCRRIWHLLTDERSRRAVEVAERYTDGFATADELDTASDAACAVWDTDSEGASTGGGRLAELGGPLPYSAAAYNVAIPLGWWGAAPAFVAPYKIILEATPDREVEGTGQCIILRDLFGNPFRPPPPLAPSVLQWHGGTVVRLARAAHEERELPSGHLDRHRLAVLADALEEAGCTDAEILGHLRDPGPHTRGCHAVDAVLGRT